MKLPQLRTIRSLFTVADNDPDLILSQHKAVAGQIPLLYFILLLNTVALAATHLRLAPLALTILPPALFIVGALVRVAGLKRLLARPVDVDTALRALRRTNRAAPLIALAVLSWALSLSPYGDAFAKVHVAFYVSITEIGCIFCLMNLRSAALMVTIIVAVPCCLVFLSSGQSVIVAIGVNFMLVTLCMIMVLLRHYRDFILLCRSRQELVVRQTETQRLSDENFRLANLDTLTGLPNRRAFFRDLEIAIGEIGRQDLAAPSALAIGLIDLDGFKGVNDAFGHRVGDMVLHEVGCRLHSFAGNSLCIARLGGDEFGLLLRSASEPALLEVAHAVCASLRAPYVTAFATADLSASLGLALLPADDCGAMHLFERADYALYHAKQSLRGLPVMFSPAHQDAIRDAARLDRTLRQADLEAELFMVFQPIFDAELGRTVAFECLARWDSPELGAIGPDIFIKAAERCNLINRLTEVLLRKSLAAASSWPEHMHIAFNLSVRDVGCDEAMRRIAEIVLASGIAPHRIEFEITETAVMRDFEQARQTLSFLRDLGARIALDDFGTGYSSLSYVHRLPLDKIKVDRSFTADIEKDAACLNIVTSVLDLCRNLKLRCVVEGLESAPQVAILKQLGCSLMQGYYFAHPMRLDDLSDYLAVEARARSEAVRYPSVRLTAPVAV